MTTHTHTPAQFLYTSCSVPGISFYAALYCLHLLALCSQAAHCLLGRAPPAEISLKKHLASNILSLKCCQNDFLYQIFPKCRIKTEISDQNLNLSSDV